MLSSFYYTLKMQHQQKTRSFLLFFGRYPSREYHGAKSCVAYLFLSLEAVSRDMEHGAFNLIIVELMMRS